MPPARGSRQVRGVDDRRQVRRRRKRGGGHVRGLERRLEVGGGSPYVHRIRARYRPPVPSSVGRGRVVDAKGVPAPGGDRSLASTVSWRAGCECSRGSRRGLPAARSDGVYGARTSRSPLAPRLAGRPGPLAPRLSVRPDPRAPRPGQRRCPGLRSASINGAFRGWRRTHRDPEGMPAEPTCREVTGFPRNGSLVGSGRAWWVAERGALPKRNGAPRRAPRWSFDEVRLEERAQKSTRRPRTAFCATSSLSRYSAMTSTPGANVCA